MNQEEVLRDTPYGQGSILTYTGKRFFPLEPRAEDVDPVDIAHALGAQCRYTGHTKFFYSVDEHSCLMYDYALRESDDEEFLTEILTHDYNEAYLVDLAAPVKHHVSGFGKVFKEASDRIERAIDERFGIIRNNHVRVKQLDLRIRTTEMKVLFPSEAPKEDWGEPLPVHICGWSPVEAKAQMLFRMQSLGIVKRDGKGDYFPVGADIPLTSSWYY